MSDEKSLIDRLMDEPTDWGAEKPPVPMKVDSTPEIIASEPKFLEQCPKCKGTGQWAAGKPCFKCKGRGNRSFKTSAEAREKKRLAAIERKDKAVANWPEAYPQQWAWIEKNAAATPFAASMLGAVQRLGRLTENQMNAVTLRAKRDAETDEWRRAGLAALKAKGGK